MVSFRGAIPLTERPSEHQQRRQDGPSRPPPTSAGYSSLPSKPPPSSSWAPSASRWQWFRPLIEGRAPAPRGGHTATLVDDRVVVFGGHKYGGTSAGFVYYNDLHVLHLRASKWTHLRHRGTPPAPRYGHSAVLVGRKIIFFGGKGKQHVFFNDLHALEVDTSTWLQGPPASSQPCRPTARFGHSCNLDDARRCLYIFGGVRDKELFNDFYCLDLVTMGWSLPLTRGAPPAPRFGHAAVVVKDYLLICGGMHRVQQHHLVFSSTRVYALNDADVQLEATEKRTLLQHVELKDWYALDLTALELKTLAWHRIRTRGSPPPPRFGHSLEAVGRNLVIFGGWAGSKMNNNTVTKDTSPNAIRQTQGESVPPDGPQILPFNLLSCFNADKMMWEACVSLGNAPLTRYGHSCTRIGSKLVIFGGWDATISLNDVIVLSDITPREGEEVLHRPSDQEQKQVKTDKMPIPAG